MSEDSPWEVITDVGILFRPVRRGGADVMPGADARVACLSHPLRSEQSFNHLVSTECEVLCIRDDARGFFQSGCESQFPKRKLL